MLAKLLVSSSRGSFSELKSYARPSVSSVVLLGDATGLRVDKRVDECRK